MWKRTDEEPGFLTPTTAKAAAPRTTGEPSMIGRSLVLRGELRGQEDLFIEGRVEGTVLFESHCVTVGEHGSVTGDVYAREIRVRGVLEGDLHGSEQVVVHETGQVRGNITAPRVCLENGAKLKGTIDMDPQPQAEMVQTAVDGAMKAQSELEKLQNGAKAKEKKERESLDAVQ